MCWYEMLSGDRLYYLPLLAAEFKCHNALRNPDADQMHLVMATVSQHSNAPCEEVCIISRLFQLSRKE